MDSYGYPDAVGHLDDKWHEFLLWRKHHGRYWMNCRRRGAPGASKQVEKDPSKEGNAVFKGGDKHGMEYKPVKRKPFWEGEGKLIDENG